MPVLLSECSTLYVEQEIFLACLCWRGRTKEKKCEASTPRPEAQARSPSSGPPKCYKKGGTHAMDLVE